MADDTLLGRNYSTADLVAKVTGRAKYAEDFRADGMLFCKLLLSPRPHCRVRGVDARAAEAMPGVKAILRASDLPAAAAAPPLKGHEDAVFLRQEVALTDEPVYEGEPILAVAAVDELTAAEALERIRLDLEPLPFVVDPLESLRPSGPDARLEGNAYVGQEVKTIKWSAQDFAAAPEGSLPMGEAGDTWEYGDLEAGFRNAALVLDDTFMTQSSGHMPLETRSAMAYWQNGKLYLHGSTQSVAQTVETVAQWVGTDPANVVVISEYTGGGFGSKIPGAPSMAIPALLAKKTGMPVMMRISREEELFIGRARPGLLARVKAGFRADGRVTAVDLFIVQDNGPYEKQWDHDSAASICSLAYQPEAMRFRGISVLTNTPPRTYQRSPGGMQQNAIMEPILAKAARELKIDQVDIHRVNAPSGQARFGPADEKGQRSHVTSAFVREALDKGAAAFRWTERRATSGQRRGSKVRGVGVAVSPYSGGYSVGYDGLLTIRPDGKLYVQTGIGNHGTHSVMDIARVAADVLGMPWDRVEVVFGSTARHVPWTCTSDGSQTMQAMSRANHAAAMDAKRKLQAIAARDLGGRPDDFEVNGGRVFRRGAPVRGLDVGQAAARAVALGGQFDGHDLPADIHPMTKTSATALAGLGLMGVAKDTYAHEGSTHSYVIGFAEVEVDVETGAVTLLDYTAIADVGTVINPRSLSGQVLGGGCMGIGHALTQRWTFDPHYGLPVTRRFHHVRPLTMLDLPPDGMHCEALDLPDPDGPIGARGVGEPPVGAGFGAVLAAIGDAIGYDLFQRSPVTADVVLSSLAAGRRVHPTLTAHL
ncbi:MAG: xanthine dehydrogenase family protein molybdopterin-binding subunit [Acidobacteriota bacterium]|nr:xanthine dehydrogenase family protein molybdopterin-binding subunit [Acidobacteriota bacterium]